MALSIEEIKERLQKPKHRSIISKAVLHENRLKFHTESYMEQSDITQPANVFLEWVKTLIPKDKYAVFVSLFKFPTPNIQLTNTIYQELERVFDGKNPSFNYQFEESVCRDDWEYYRQEVLKEPDVWRTKGWAAVKTAI
ncbi:MAG: hypothetical protein ACRCZY_03350, partial [Phocaeicola sp.]